MSRHFGEPHGQVSQKAKCQLEILRKDNANERPWLDSITRWVRKNGAMKFLLRKFNQSRKIDYGNDFSKEGPLKNFVKIEPADEATPSGQGDDGDDGDEANDEARALIDQPADAPEDILPLFTMDGDDLDNTELTMMNKIRIFTDPSLGDKPEDEASAKLRFKFYDELCKSCPYHASIVKVIIPGDCYDFISKITKSTVVTNRSKFEHHKRMCSIRWNGTVSRVVNELLQGQQKADQLKDSSWDDDMMKGALLTICQEQPSLRGLIVTLSRPDAKSNFKECVKELLTAELHAPATSRSHTGSARRTTEQKSGHYAKDRKKREESRKPSDAKSKTSSEPRIPLEEYKAKCAKQYCKNFQAGKCKFSEKECWRKHEYAPKALSAKEQQSDQSWYDMVHPNPGGGRAFMARGTVTITADELLQVFEDAELDEARQRTFQDAQVNNEANLPLGADHANQPSDPWHRDSDAFSSGEGYLSSQAEHANQSGVSDELAENGERTYLEAGNCSWFPIVISDSNASDPELEEANDAHDSGADGDDNASSGDEPDFEQSVQRPVHGSARRCIARRMPSEPGQDTNFEEVVARQQQVADSRRLHRRIQRLL